MRLIPTEIASPRTIPPIVLISTIRHHLKNRRQARYSAIPTAARLQVRKMVAGRIGVPVRALVVAVFRPVPAPIPPRSMAVSPAAARKYKAATPKPAPPRVIRPACGISVLMAHPQICKEAVQEEMGYVLDWAHGNVGVEAFLLIANRIYLVEGPIMRSRLTGFVCKIHNQIIKGGQ